MVAKKRVRRSPGVTGSRREADRRLIRLIYDMRARLARSDERLAEATRAVRSLNETLQRLPGSQESAALFETQIHALRSTIAKQLEVE